LVISKGIIAIKVFERHLTQIAYPKKTLYTHKTFITMAKPATQTRWANILTGIVAIVATVQSSLATPPFSPESIKIVGGVLAFSSILFTYLKQKLSADVSNKGKNLTFLLIGLPAVIMGAGDMLNLFEFTNTAAHWITWSISVLLMLVTVLSKLLFPSEFQKDKIEELKTMDKAKTQ
jgi:hypothetical protein